MSSVEALMLTIYKIIPLCLILGTSSWLIVRTYEWFFGPLDDPEYTEEDR